LKSIPRQRKRSRGRVLGDASACMVTAMAALGDRLNLFKELASSGSVTGLELADRTGLDARYLREWLGGMATARYLTYMPSDGRFQLPAEHAAVLADEGGLFFAGGALQLTLAKLPQIGRVAEAFRMGGGVPESAFGDDLCAGHERFSTGWVDNLLTQFWLPAMVDVQDKLARGAAVADVGCGRGLALVKLAQTYPNSYFVGYDQVEAEITQATERAQQAGVADRVRFQHLDATAGLPSQYEVVTTFDVVHDAADPRGLVRAIREALVSDGIYVCLETNCSDKLEDNLGPLGALFYGISLFYCLTTSLAHGGAGLGTLGLPEPALRELCVEAGFRNVQRVPMDNPFNALYEVHR
jgi:SAM-dependent methyltransferase